MASTVDAACWDPYERWGPVSALRPFDVTRCFEEGVVLSSLLVLFIVSAFFRCYTARNLDVYHRCQKSRLILTAKVVRIINPRTVRCD